MRKKFLQGAATLSMAAAVCIMSGLVTASADTLPKEKVTVDYEKQQVIVDLSGSVATNPGGGGAGGSDSDADEPTGHDEGDGTVTDPSTTTTDSNQEILFNVASVNKNKELKASTWEVYDVGADKKVTIDITSLNTQKDNYVQIKGDVSKDPITLFIPATDKTLRLKFNAYSGLAEFNKGADASKTANYEYRTEYSDWSDAAKLADISLKMYQERGAKLYFRLSKSVDSMAVSAAGASNEVKDIKDKANNGETLANVYKMPSLPGKEIKVSVGKKANAPKASVNYAKGAVTIPNGAMYRINGEDADGKYKVGLIDWSAPTSSKVTLDSKSTGDAKTAYDALVAGGSLEVKKAGVSDKGKAESKVFQLAFPNAKEILSVGGAEDEKKNVTENTIVDPSDETGKQTVKVSSIDAVKNKKGETTSFKMTVKNDTDYNYEIVVDSTKPGADKKGKVVKTKKDATITGIKKEGGIVYIRRCADQKKQAWATEYAQMGVVPAAATETPDKPGTEDPKEPTVKELLTSLSSQLFESEVKLASGAKAGSGVNVVKTGENVTWNAAEDYTLKENSKKMEGITITAVSSAPAKIEVDYTDTEGGPILLAAKEANWENTDPVTITVTLTNGSENITKEITVKPSEE